MQLLVHRHFCSSWLIPVYGEVAEPCKQFYNIWSNKKTSSWRAIVNLLKEDSHVECRMNVQSSWPVYWSTCYLSFVKDQVVFQKAVFGCTKERSNPKSSRQSTSDLPNKGIKDIWCYACHRGGHFAKNCNIIRAFLAMEDRKVINELHWYNKFYASQVMWKLSVPIP